MMYSALILFWIVQGINAWLSGTSLSSPAIRRISGFPLHVARKLHNKQADLKRKMEQAKNKQPDKLSDEEIKALNDRQRFQELLLRTVVSNDLAEGNTYLTKQQEEEVITAARSRIDRIFEGDPAPVDCFEELVSIKSENAIGAKGKERLVPWLGKSQQEYMVVLCDPRLKSPELQQSMKELKRDLPLNIYSRLIVINADSPAENRRWLKKNDMEDKIEIYSDEKMEWMRTFTALGEKRWSMTVFVIADGKVQKLAREVDVYDVTRTIMNAVKSMEDDMRL